MRFIPTVPAVLLMFALVTAQSHAGVDITVDKIDISKVTHKEEGPKVNSLPIDNNSEWIRITAKYEVALSGKAKKESVDGYVDELTFAWTVVLPCKDKSNRPSEKRSFLLTEKVKYANIEADGDHYAVIYLTPKVYERLKERMIKTSTLFIDLRVTANGRTRARAWSNGRKFHAGTKMPKELFPKIRSGSWFESEEINHLKWGLVTRRHTPWDWASDNSYEEIVPDNK